MNRDELRDKSIKAMDKAMNVINEVANRVNTSITSIKTKPDRIGVEFGVRFDTELGVIIAKASMEAGLDVKLEWDLKQTSDSKIDIKPV